MSKTRGNAPLAGDNAAAARRSNDEQIGAAGGKFEIFLAVAPGLEGALANEARSKSFQDPKVAPGGVEITGGWADVWRANLQLRGAGRVIARVAAFRALHLAQLDKRARRVRWADVLRADAPFRVEATCSKSRIYHSGAAVERIERAIREQLGATASPDAEVCIRARIEHDLCAIGIDTSGEPLHKRGMKLAVSKAPMRETLASLMLLECGFDGGEPVVDPMCGSGTFVIEAAEIAAGLAPGRARRFAFEALATFDEAAWTALRGGAAAVVPTVRFSGSDIDPGAMRMSRENALRSGVDAFAAFEQRPIDDVAAPEGPPGLVIVNPPYGDRIGGSDVAALYRRLGATLLRSFKGWRVGLVTSESALARATGLPFARTSAPISHGGLRVTLYQTPRLG